MAPSSRERRRPLGEPVSLPVDTSTRAFRRACSEPRFPFACIERDSATLKDAPIQFRWKSGTMGCESPPSPKNVSSPELKTPPVGRTAGNLSFDPHRSGFGPIRGEAQVRKVKPSPDMCGPRRNPWIPTCHLYTRPQSGGGRR